MPLHVNAVYLKESPKASINQLSASAFNTVITTFIGFTAQGQGIVDGPMGDWQPAEWINQLRGAGKKLLFAVGGSALSPNDLKFLFRSTKSALLDSAKYGKFSETIAKILHGGPMTLLTNQGASYPTDYGQGFHGVDFDLENFPNYVGGAISNLWADRLSALNQALRRDLPPGTLITHAPQTPYMLSTTNWPGANGANKNALYSRMMLKSGNAVDWLNVQLYNQGNFSQAALNAAVSALLNDWPLATDTSPSKVVLTVALGATEAGSGYVRPEMLQQAIMSEAAHRLGGFNGWSYSSDTSVNPPWDQFFDKLLQQLADKIND